MRAFKEAEVGLIDLRVAVVGLGLMGGSLALALRGRCKELLGIDINPAVVSIARQRGVVDRASTDLTELLPVSNLIVLAGPVLANLELLKQLPSHHPGQAVVIDLGSTKQAVTEAMATLPARFDPIGGHPMCGKEIAGLENAEVGLFQGAPFALCPLPRTSYAGRVLATELVDALGARPVWIDAEHHDCWVAATSHVPYLIACALAVATPDEALKLTGPGLRSATRLAGTDPAMMGSILKTNRGLVLDALHRLQHELEDIEQKLSDEDWTAIETTMQQACQRYGYIHQK